MANNIVYGIMADSERSGIPYGEVYVPVKQSIVDYMGRSSVTANPVCLQIPLDALDDVVEHGPAFSNGTAKGHAVAVDLSKIDDRYGFDTNSMVSTAQTQFWTDVRGSSGTDMSKAVDFLVKHNSEAIDLINNSSSPNASFAESKANHALESTLCWVCGDTGRSLTYSDVYQREGDWAAARLLQDYGITSPSLTLAGFANEHEAERTATKANDKLAELVGDFNSKNDQKYASSEAKASAADVNDSLIGFDNSDSYKFNKDDIYFGE